MVNDFANCVGPGWRPLVMPLIELCQKHGVNIHQVKEKFGGLRFYVGFAPEEIHTAIGIAEARSTETCEDCGAPGWQHSIRGWLRTLCAKCANQQ